MRVDFHAHLDTSWERVDRLLCAQARAGIERTVVVSGNMLDTSFMADYFRGRHPLKETLPNNDFLEQAAARHPDRLLPFFTIDPAYHLPHDIDDAAKGAFLGFKLNTIVHQVDFTSAALHELLDGVSAFRAPLYLHITLNAVANLEAAVQLARRFTGLNLVIGHMGFATADRAAIAAAEAIPNVYLESSIGSILAFEEVKRRRLAGKLLFGSEFPMHDPEIELAKLRLVFEQPDIEMIGSENSLALLKWKERIPP
jgi:predicted TIM-barrel fold metal-dependent hydrolase